MRDVVDYHFAGDLVTSENVDTIVSRALLLLFWGVYFSLSCDAIVGSLFSLYKLIMLISYSASLFNIALLACLFWSCC